MNDPSHPLGTEPKPVPWTVREGVLVWIFAVLLTVPFAIVIRTEDTLFLVLLTAQSGILFVLVVTWLGLRHGRGPEALGLEPPRKSQVLAGVRAGFLGVLLAYPITTAVVYLIQLATDETVDLPNQIDLKAPPGGPTLAYIGFAVIIVAPLVEESFFRGFLYPALRRIMSIRAAIVVSAALFGLAHLTFLVMVPTFVLGVILATMKERHGSLTAPIATHVVFNAFGFTLYVLTR